MRTTGISKQAAPCPVPYQGSKRRLAQRILAHAPTDVTGRFIEPFAGSAAMSLAAATKGIADEFVVGEILPPLAEIWNLIVSDPEGLALSYDHLWHAQLEDPRAIYDRVRDEFNKDHDPAKLLYLLARCVKNAVRFNSQGDFNQSPDNRRKGMNPKKMRREIFAAHELLRGRTKVMAADYRDVLEDVREDDLVYMDPPYQGVSSNRDRRYRDGLDLDAFIIELARLNQVQASYIISFDGRCGDRTYGTELPQNLDLVRIELVAGRSTQATLLGRTDVTVESLYLSTSLVKRVGPKRLKEAGDNVKQLSFT